MWCMVELLPTPIVATIISSLHLLIEWTIDIVQYLAMENQAIVVSHALLSIRW